MRHQTKEDKKREKKNFRQAMERELREHRSSFVVYMVLRAFVIVTMVLQMLNHNYENVFLCILTLLLLIIPGLLQVRLRIELPTGLEIILLVFIFAAEILGEIGAYYIKYPIWDTMLHTVNGFLMAAIGFSLVDILDRDERLKFDLSPFFTALVAFCFSMTIGIIWEFFEFGMDMFFELDMQKDTVISGISSVLLDPAASNHPVRISEIREVAVNGESLGLGGYLDIGLIDTMKDLFVNFIGAVAFSVVGYFYIKNRGKGKVAGQFIPILKREEADFLKQIKEEKQN